MDRVFLCTESRPTSINKIVPPESTLTPEPTPPPAPAPTAKDNLVSPVHDFHNLGQTPTTSLPGTTDSYLLAKFGAAVDRATVVAAQLAHEKQRHGSDAARETAHRCLASLSSTDPAPPPPPPTKWGTTFDDFHNAVIQTAAFRTAHFRGA
ncbi:hypothetical protein BASA60_009432 [Batrachochytrium salamandrivorans]|nr:hypothetical protein BASA60_009432 [Batrachochytrium salamandrivorans]